MTPIERFNSQLAEALTRRFPPRLWEVETGAVAVDEQGGITNLAAVITPVGANASRPVVIHTASGDPADLDKEARRLIRVAQLMPSGRPIVRVAAVRPELPTAEADADAPAAESPDSIRCQYRLLSVDGPFSDLVFGEIPRSGWLNGTISDIADDCELFGPPGDMVEAAAAAMVKSVRIHRSSHTTAGMRAAAELMQSPLDRDLPRRVWTLVLNAVMCQAAMAGARLADDYTVPRPEPGDGRDEMLEVWRRMAASPSHAVVFDLPARLLECLHADDVGQLFRKVNPVALRLASRAWADGNLAGPAAVALATKHAGLPAGDFTRPPAAHLLAELAVAEMGADWGDPDGIGGLRAVDFACGTGVLLDAAYDRMAARMRAAGLDDEVLHSEMLENVMVGADVNPAAVALTASLLAIRYPAQPLERIQVRLASMGFDDEGECVTPDDSSDLVIMHPPSSKATISEFVVRRAHDFIRPGGVLALVLPTELADDTKTYAAIWGMLAVHYRRHFVVTTPSEVLLVATRSQLGQSGGSFEVKLSGDLPASLAEAVAAGRLIHSLAAAEPASGKVQMGRLRVEFSRSGNPDAWRSRPARADG